MKTRIFNLGLLMGLMLLAVNSVFACPGCKDGFAAGTEGARLGDSYSISVLFMLGVPMTLVTIFTIVIARKVRQNRNEV